MIYDNKYYHIAGVSKSERTSNARVGGPDSELLLRVQRVFEDADEARVGVGWGGESVSEGEPVDLEASATGVYTSAYVFLRPYMSLYFCIRFCTSLYV